MVVGDPARQGRRAARVGRGGRRRGLTGGGNGGQANGHFFAPAVVTGAPAETALLSEETFGPVAPIVPVEQPRRGDRARQLHPLRPRGEHLHPGLQDDPALHARDQGRHRLVQRPIDRQRRRPVRRLQAIGPRPRTRPARDSRPSRRPSTCTSSRRSPQGMVVPLLRIRGRTKKPAARRVAEGRIAECPLASPPSRPAARTSALRPAPCGAPRSATDQTFASDGR